MNTLVAGSLVVCAMSSSAEVRIQIIPEQPVENEPVYARVTSEVGDALDTGNFRRNLSSMYHMSEGDIRILAGRGIVGVPPQGDPVDFVFYLGRLPQGTYQIGVMSNGMDPPLGSVSLTVEGSNRWRFDGEENRNPHDHSGMWWNPDAPGTSIVLQMSPTSRDLGGGFYAYDSEGSPVWYALTPGVWHNAALDFYRAKAYRSTGSGFGEAHDPDEFEATEIGYMDLHFIGTDTLSAKLVIEGVEREVMLRRFDF